MARPGHRLPVHVIVGFGATCAAYAGALLLVTALEGGRQQATRESLAPLDGATAALAARNDALADSLQRTSAAYDETVRAYEALGPLADQSTERLHALAGQLKALHRSLTTVAVPAVPRGGALGQVATIGSVSVPPVSHATTGGSGKP